ncbi:MAG TPA: guanitoxin biosynthesis heme-dependent pre-guanitoxin N-hydroxylase GntA [Bacteriovoracaceae bacterium]|nr:guanitoxin biosynthesis heme-dependent pre-guanitoxin N-hydroxylase GntA [Bacteriovoracaceae bacterium]
MKEELKNFIQNSAFPCIMAKAVAAQGLIHPVTINQLEGEDVIKHVLDGLYDFVEQYRLDEEKLSSFALVIDNDKYGSFEIFEKAFWKFLSDVNQEDKFDYSPDPRVSADPLDSNFSFSIKSEAFFILALHPESPRWARRFKYPAIIFNPHQQFERLRTKGVFSKVRDIIRFKDKLLQGDINPMLNDFGEISEVFQYSGKVHNLDGPVPLSI